MKRQNNKTAAIMEIKTIFHVLNSDDVALGNQEKIQPFGEHNIATLTNGQQSELTGEFSNRVGFNDVPLMEFIRLFFTRMSGESYSR